MASIWVCVCSFGGAQCTGGRCAQGSLKVVGSGLWHVQLGGGGCLYSEPWGVKSAMGGFLIVFIV